MVHINPAFDGFAEEEALIGRMILTFGELEWKFVSAAGIANGEWLSIMRALFRLRATAQRIDAADAMIRPFADREGFGGEYGLVLGAIRYCHTIRNEFAHCNWASDPAAGLFYTKIEDAVKPSSYRPYEWRHVDQKQLSNLEDVFRNSFAWLNYLHGQLHFAQGFDSHPPATKPKLPVRPPLHNPPEKHPPPWMLEDKTTKLARRIQEEKASRRLDAQQAAPQTKKPPEA